MTLVTLIVFIGGLSFFGYIKESTFSNKLRMRSSLILPYRLGFPSLSLDSKVYLNIYVRVGK